MAEKFVCLLITKAELCQCSFEAFIFFSLPAHLLALGATQPQVQWILYVKWNLKLTTHFHLVFQLRMCEGLPLRPLYTFTDCCLDTYAALPLLVCSLLLCWMDCVDFEFPTALTMNSTNFWGVTPYSMAKVHQCFWGTHCLHLQGQRRPRPSMNPARSEWQAEQLPLLLPTCWCFTWLTL
jgi:hypothetical protein